jgi:LysR family nitrogen assimilation transcriptional regulator
VHLLEEDLGTQLFERQRYGMALTDAGKSLLGYARRAMLELDRARGELSGSTTEVTGIVTVGLLPSTADVLASPLVAAVTQDYPGVRIRIAMGYAGTLQQWLDSGEIDMAIIYGVKHAPLIRVRPLLSEPFWIVGHASAQLSKLRPVTLAGISGKPMILPDGPHSIRSVVERLCIAANVKLHVSVETNAMSIQKSLVLGGLGFTILPPISFAQELASGQLTGAPLDEPQLTRTISLAQSAHRAGSRAVRHVEEILVRCMKEAVKSNRWPEALWIAE